MATYTFTTPSVLEGFPLPESEHWYVRAFTSSRGIGLYLEDGVYRETRTITEAMYRDKSDAVDYFIGGIVYSGVTQEVADVLIASGYGDGLIEE